MSDFIPLSELEQERDEIREMLELWNDDPPESLEERLEELNEQIDKLRNNR
jgi:DNA-binding transcriptional MerR regulator